MSRSGGPGGRDGSAHTRYAEALQEWLERARKETGSAEDTALAEEVETYLEELQVAEEELRVQTDEITSALEQADAQFRRYRDLFDSAPLPYVTTDAAGTIGEANRAAAELIGIPADRLEGKPLPLYLAGEGELRSRINRLAAGRSVQPWESAIRQREGHQIPVTISASVVPEATGRPAELRWVIQDARPALRAREQERELQREQAAREALEQVAARSRFLSEASARLMGVLEPSEVWTLAAQIAGEHARGAMLVQPQGPDSVCVRGIGGAGVALRDLEPLLGRVLEWSEQMVEGVPLRPIQMALESGEVEVVPSPDDPPDAAGACVVAPVRSAERVLGALVVWLSPGARIGEELLVAQHLADRVGLSLEAALMFQEVVRSRGAAESATAAEADFLSIVSHELRTPLTAIVSYAELLEDRAHELPEKLARYAHQIAAAADHQRQLVEQILTYKRIQREGGALALEELDYRKVARTAVAMVRPQVNGRPVEMSEHLPSVAVQGVSDRGKLQQILTNLLSNAVRHTTEGAVRLTLETRHQWVVFRVEDTGEGIAEEDIPRIFDRFWRGRPGDSSRGGSGLGLTITRELVERLHGEIEVASEPGAGSTFTVRVPRVVPGGGSAGSSRDGATTER
jgi:PAS domain S-box-containing protein